MIRWPWRKRLGPEPRAELPSPPTPALTAALAEIDRTLDDAHARVDRMLTRLRAKELGTEEQRT